MSSSLSLKQYSNKVLGIAVKALVFLLRKEMYIFRKQPPFKSQGVMSMNIHANKERKKLRQEFYVICVISLILSSSVCSSKAACYQLLSCLIVQ